MGKHFKKAYMTMFQERLQAVTRKGAPGHDLVNILNNDVREDRFRLRNGTISIETVVTEYGDLPKVMKRELRLSRKESKALIRGGLSAMGDYDYFIANQPQDTTDVMVFGHTHVAKLQRQQPSLDNWLIYANSGGWVDPIDIDKVFVDISMIDLPLHDKFFQDTFPNLRTDRACKSGVPKLQPQPDTTRVEGLDLPDGGVTQTMRDLVRNYGLTHTHAGPARGLAAAAGAAASLAARLFLTAADTKERETLIKRVEETLDAIHTAAGGLSEGEAYVVRREEEVEGLGEED
ncbi:unnamed protein product [Vitrella brassicaformis CCMP3155]|uniref:Calcineurin-like phosphoesterase domain-containing protein n=1 Tax=Vitrella brassicaformis (strain CCMP3155) TaxID=1169540 RepID=A0A0G4GAI4_VITBC|nr:unnamed protein product [Vitrella brassicaformis CCMP3155]|eukprot:CEM25984.1 unnamed protein product [Vitrella brassicaformis CCMP3155]